MHRNRVVLAAVLTLTLAGCGGGERSGTADSGSTPSPSFDDAAFKAEVESVCADLNAITPEEEKNYQDVAEIQADLKVMISTFEKASAKFAALTYPPSAEGAELRRILVDENSKNFVELKAAGQQFNAAVAAKDEARFYEAADRFIALSDAEPDKKGALKSYGLTECDLAFGPDA